MITSGYSTQFQTIFKVIETKVSQKQICFYTKSFMYIIDMHDKSVVFNKKGNFLFICLKCDFEVILFNTSEVLHR